MTFCEHIAAAIKTAPDKETKEALQAIYDAYCVAQTEGGGNGNGPPGGDDD